MQLKMTAAELKAYMAEEFPQIGGTYVLDTLGPMRAVLRLEPQERHLRPGGTISGPTIFGLADCAAYYAILGMIGRQALAVTTNASIDFMRKPQPGAALVAEVEILKLGRVLAVADVKIRSDGSDVVVARATLTYSIPPRR